MSGNDDEGDWKDKEVPASKRPGVPEDLQEDAENAGKKLKCKTKEEQEATAKEPDGLESGRHSDELWDGNNEDRVATVQPLTPEGSKVRNVVELGGNESDEDMGYFQKEPQGESEMNTQGNCLPEEEREQANERWAESDDSEFKDEENEANEANSLTLLAPQEDGGPCGDYNILDFPVQDLVQSLEELVYEDDTVEGTADKVEDFTGDDHQEAGETFAEFPPDFYSWGDDEVTDEERKCNLGAQLSALSEMSYLDREIEPTLLGTVNIDNKVDPDVCPGWTETAVDTKHKAFTAGEMDNKCKSKTHPYAPRTVLPERWSDVGDEVGACLEDEDPTQDEVELIGAANLICSLSDKNLHNFYDYTFASESIFDIRPQTIHNFSSSDDEIQDNKTDGEYKRDDLSLHESVPVISPPPLQKHNDEMRTICEDSSLTKICTTLVAPACNEDYVSANMPLFSEDSTLNTEDEDKQKSQPSLEAAQSAKVASKDPFNIDVQDDIHLITLLSNQGSVYDGFFFTHEDQASGVAELGHFGDDEYEDDERNWEREQERIQAFNEFYNDSNWEIDHAGRKTKVHFCTDLLSQVIHYDSEEDSFDSSTEAEEEMIAAETHNLQYNVVPQSVAGHRDTQLQTRKHKCLGLLKTILKMSLVIGMGLLVLWWSMDETVFPGLPLFKG